MRQWIPNIRYGGHAFGKQSFEEFLGDRETLLPWIAEYSPYALVSAGDPPAYMTFDNPPDLGKNQKDATHSANFGVKLQERCKEFGIETELAFPGATGVVHQSTTDYLIAKLTGPRSGATD